MEFSRIDIITNISKIAPLQEALGKLGVSGMTLFQAIGCGVENGTQEYELEKKKTPDFLPKELLMLVVPNDIVDQVTEVVKKELYTGHIGDGKIFISPITNAIRVRTGEEGADALK